jgi:ketosteroid isomerase-like protein
LNFATLERLASAAPELVLGVLEKHLHNKGWGEQRAGSEITLSGLGPSPRTINRRDTTVMNVVGDGAETRIDARVTFQASALLAPDVQEQIVRSKLQQILDAVKAQVEEEEIAEKARRLAASKEIEANADREMALASEGADTSALVENRLWVMEKYAEPEDKGPWRWIAASTCIMVLVIAAPLAILSMVVRHDTAVRAAARTAASKHSAEINVEQTMRQWELAMRSRDAEAQSALYASPLEEYRLFHNLNHKALQAMKQAEIDHRRGLWTMSIEKVAIVQVGDDATVSLVKHVMEQPEGSRVSEKFIPSRLTLRHSPDGWKITAERDLQQRASVEPLEEAMTSSVFSTE